MDKELLDEATQKYVGVIRPWSLTSGLCTNKQGLAV